MPKPSTGWIVCLTMIAQAGCAASRPPAGSITRDGPELETLLSTSSLSDLSLAPGGRTAMLTSTFDGHPTPLIVDLDSGKYRRVVSEEAASLRAVEWFPDGRRVLLGGDAQGDEQVHLYVASGMDSVSDLTPGDRRRALFLGWANDGKSFFISDNQRDPRYADVFRVDATDYEPELMYRDTLGLEFGAISGDGGRIAFIRPSGQTGGRLFLWDASANHLSEMPDQTDSAAAVPRLFSRDGKYLYVTTNERTDFARLERVHVTSGERDVLFEPDWDVTGARRLGNGERLLVEVNEDARTRLYVLEPGDRSARALPLPRALAVRGVATSEDASVVAFLATTGRTPTSLYLLDPDEAQGPRLVMSGLPADVDSAAFVPVEVIRYPSFDGRMIPALMYRPHGATEKDPVPFVLWAHGGPGGQSTIGFSPLLQYLATGGYGVLEINNRGSEGYGKEFWRLDDRRHGDVDLDDFVAAKDWLATIGWADPSRVAIMGASYGGYLVLAALAFRPEEFSAGVDLYGISNWVRTMANLPPWWEPFLPALEREMGPLDDLDFFRAKSPAFHADQIVRPLFVVQGANDPRVLPAESDEIVEKLRRRGVPVTYLLFEDEGHGLRKRDNRLEAYRGIREFLNRHVAGDDR